MVRTSFRALYDWEEDFREKGYIVLPCDPKRAFRVEQMYDDYLEDIPEMQNKDASPVAGGFGALGFASSFYCPAAVHADELASDVVSQTLIKIGRREGYKNLEMLPDRLMYRTRMTQAETYHRDETKGAEEGDVFFGGMLNLNSNVTQKFLCVPRSHRREANVSGTGFTTVSGGNETTVRVPPYHLMLFYESIVHRVAPYSGPPLKRKFLAFRLTKHDEPWFGEANNERFARQAVPHYKSGDLPRMFPKLYLTNHIERLQTFARQLIPALRITHTVGSGARQGQTYEVPLVHAPSLQSLGLMYPHPKIDRFRMRPLSGKFSSSRLSDGMWHDHS